MTCRLFLLMVVIILAAGACSRQDIVPEPETPDNDTETTGNYNVDKTVLLQLVNDVRKTGCNCGSTAMPPVNAVSWNDLLAKAAYDHSADMNAQDYFSHTGADGSSPGTRITATGYRWRSYGENIAKGYSNENAVMQGWLNSEGHCKNIMNASFKEMGAGRDGAYWTQVFGAQ